MVRKENNVVGKSSPPNPPGLARNQEPEFLGYPVQVSMKDISEGNMKHCETLVAYK